ncbi:MAG: DNA topoisomerase VI subunit B [Deltaproteobacteria bacterium HGW-Deltaproteobacteria-22]|nr:MAG: DNA topoisomerase VI subunit B [Deltaproteobacteria bacterium HGW-Deltaproteobacteria-22]
MSKKTMDDLFLFTAEPPAGKPAPQDPPADEDTSDVIPDADAPDRHETGSFMIAGTDNLFGELWEDAGPGDGGPSAGTDQRVPRQRPRVKAEEFATQQREISISEFFAKNKQLLGFDSAARALMTTVKEAVDNSLDACEDAGILPTLIVEIVNLEDNRMCVIVQDNGPGIVREQIPKIFAQLLYGSKFHRLRQSRGQQGIGISAAGMYGQLTTGKPMRITSRIGERHPAHYFELMMDLKKNRARIVKDMIVDWDVGHGTRVEIELEAQYKSGRQSLDEYLAQTAVANPHTEIFYTNPRGEKLHFPRVAMDLPRQPEEIRPHPHGVELGMLIKMLRESPHRRVSASLQHEFSRVTPRIAEEICQLAGVPITRNPQKLTGDEIQALYKAIPQVKILAPPATAVVPIGEELLRRGLARQIRGAEFYVSRSRNPRVYRGNPFLVEVAIAYGGELQGLVDHGDPGDIAVAGVSLDQEKTVASALLDLPGFTRKKVAECLEKSGISPRKRVKSLEFSEIAQLRSAYDTYARQEADTTSAQIIRLANRVPLLYQLKACAISKAIMDMNWRRYGVTQPRGGFPQGPLVIMVHFASVWVPFTSESKEAVAHYEEILEEIRLALQDCARELSGWLARKVKIKANRERKSLFQRYIPDLARSLAVLTGGKAKDLDGMIQEALEEYAEQVALPEMVDLEAERVPVNAFDGDGDGDDDNDDDNDDGDDDSDSDSGDDV